MSGNPETVQGAGGRGEPALRRVGNDKPAGSAAEIGRSTRWRGRSVAAGVAGSVIASLCCLPTAAALALGLGLGTAATLTELLAYQRLFQFAGMAFAGVTTWLMLRRRGGACGLSETHRERLPVLVMGSFAASFAILNLLIIPFLERAS